MRSGLILVSLLIALPALSFDEPAYLIRVERQVGGDLVALRSGGLAVVLETLGSLFVEGNASDLAWLREHGYAAAVLDLDPRAWDYVQVGLRPDSDGEAIRAAGREVYSEQNWRIIRVPRGADLERLRQARAFVTRISHEAVDAPRWTPLPAVAAVDPMIQQMVSAVATRDVDGYWTDLVNNKPSGTRFSGSSGCDDAVAYCHDQLEALKVPAEYQGYDAGYAPNVIGTKTGVVTPARVYIVIGHVDDMPQFAKAPGADDNASGAVTVLESARAMSCFAFRSTVKFITCTGEEQGLLGSDAYAADAAAHGEDIRGVLNFDMNGWQGDGIPSPENLDLDYNEASADLGRLFAQCAENYGTGLAVDAFLCPSLTASDHYSFWRRGYKAVCGITDNEGYCGHIGNYPYYHTSSDTIAACGDKAFFYSTIKATVATLATLAEPFKIAFSTPSVACESPARLFVGDWDLDASSTRTETVAVEVWSGTEPTPETFTLTEQGVDSMVFAGDVLTTTAAPIHGDGKVSVAGGDIVTARYVDAKDCDGTANVSYIAEIAADCSAFLPAEITGLVVMGTPATHLDWVADELATRYDVGGGSLGELLSDGNWGRAACLADDRGSVGWDDPRENPPSGDALYYLVRGENVHGSGTWGRGSNGTERVLTACP